jgi:hypothetical protein
MNEDHPTRKTIAVLAELTIDGSLSGAEIWELADFLNNNKDCRENWPGSLIFPLLANAYADGELSKDEMRTLAQMIANVEREWFWRSETSNLPAEQLSPGATPDFLDMTVPVRTRSAREYDPDTAFKALPPQHGRSTKRDSLFEKSGKKTYVLKSFKQFSMIPALPAVKCRMLIQSHTGSGEEYGVDLYEHTCTCPDWAASRYSANFGSINRACKHIAEAFLSLKHPLPGWLTAVFEDCIRRNHGTSPDANWFVLQLSKNIAVALAGSSNPWVNVYAPSGGHYERFGYNKEEDRWSYGNKPHLSRKIADFISERF